MDLEVYYSQFKITNSQFKITSQRRFKKVTLDSNERGIPN